MLPAFPFLGVLEVSPDVLKERSFLLAVVPAQLVVLLNLLEVRSLQPLL
jgi:hypothetical protein